MKNYEAKYEYFLSKQHYFCAIAAEELEDAYMTELHHKCHQKKWRHKKYPIFMDSILNLVGVSNKWHMHKPHFRKISDRQAEKYERFLSNPIHWKYKEFVHTGKWPKSK